MKIGFVLEHEDYVWQLARDKVVELSALGIVMCTDIGASLFTACYEVAEKCVKITKAYKPDEQKAVDYEAQSRSGNAAIM